jgi:Domain of unknown function (DUF4158)
MPRLDILSFSEQKDFDSSKELNGEERKLYFRINNEINILLAQTKDPTNKVALLLMLYHFKISKKFFPVHIFSARDIRYTARQLALDIMEDKKCHLGSKTFHRYKNQILEHTGYKISPDFSTKCASWCGIAGFLFFLGHNKVVRTYANHSNFL